MYRNDEKQFLMPNEFFLPFGGNLDEKNRWCVLAMMLPWAEIEKKYVNKLLSLGRGRKAYSVRMALGALIIQQKLGQSDRDTVVSITENPYMQYLLGLAAFQQTAPFDPSLMVYFRRRLGDVLIEINDMIMIAEIKRRREEESKKKPPEPPAENPNGKGPEGEQQVIGNRGVLILDATCIPADIHYPTDLRLLNEAREALEEIIDTMHNPESGQKKPRTYRENARRDYLRIAKKRKVSQKERHKGIKKQLQYLRRDIGIIHSQAEHEGLMRLSHRQYKNLLVVQEIYRQQADMFHKGKQQVQDRIVSLHMPHVRPIVRGKAGAETEFGAKLAASIVDGLVFIDKLSFDSFNESTLLISCVEKYKDRFGCYPEAVMADQIYRNRDNLGYCKTNGIRLSGKPLGRPPKDETFKAQRKKQERLDVAIRNAIEGKFGQGKRAYGLARILARLAITSEAVVAAAFLVMNLEHMLRVLFTLFLGSLFSQNKIGFQLIYYTV
jgi:transposase, IS5 family